MRKLLALAFLLSGFLFITSCNEDDPVNLDPPAVTAPSATSVQVGTSVDLTFNFTAEAGFASSIVTGATVKTDGEAAATSGTVVVTYTAGSTPGGDIVTVEVTDSEGDKDEASVAITITEEPQKPTVDVYSSAEGTGSVTWSADNIYILRGFVFVNEGQTLEIEPGTIIKGQPGQGAGASALIVAKGGKIMAEGTKENPIIFTGLADDLDGTIPVDEKSTWGGLIILGNGINNANASDNVLRVEGIPETEPRGLHGGGQVEDDNSGILTYVSIRHGGSLIGSDNEINGLTLGSVGRGTTIENIEIFSNLDDGVEFFGGNVNVKNIVISNVGDDGIDIDNGYSGSIQKGVVWTSSSNLESSDPSGAELDGATGDDESLTGTPFATPKLVNITFRYDDDEASSDLTTAINMRDNFGGSFYNCIFVGHDAKLTIEETSKTSSSWDLYADGTLKLEKNIFYNINGVTAGASFADAVSVVQSAGLPTDNDIAEFVTYLTTNNAVSDPELGTGAGALTPAADVTADLFDVSTLDASYELDVVTYKGGVDASAVFFADWTKTYSILAQ